MNRRLGSLTRRWLLFGGLGLLVALIGALQPRAASAAGCVVTSTADSGAGTLRAAIDNTNGFSNCDSITFSLPNPSRITLTTGQLNISRNLTITGPGAAALTVARSTATNTPEFSIFRFSSGTVAVTGLTVTGGQTYFGGGIISDTTSTVTDVVLSGNQATYGGGIAAESSAILRVERSLLTGNSATYGGAVFSNLAATSSSGMTVISSTIVGNEAYLGGGAATIGRVTLLNSTVSGNGADFGGNVYNGRETRLQNTLVANSARGGNCANPFTDLGYNLADDGSCSLNSANNSLSNTPAGLDPAGLRDNGGPTKTIALLPGSAALNRIPTSGAECPTTDQRGIARPQGAACDIGAFESRGFALAYTSGTGQSAVINTTFTTPLVATVSSASGEPVAGGVVTFTGPGSGAGIANSPLTATIGTNGQASRPVSANGAAGGPYTVTASAAGVTGSPTFSLTNLGIPTTLAANAASGTYGGTVTLSARLTVTSGGAAVNGKTVAFSLNGTPVGTATTNASGVATLNSVSLGIIGANSYATGVGAAFAGDATYAVSSGSANLSIARADQSITFATPGTSPAPTFSYGTDSSFTVGATATSGLPVSFSAYTPPGTPDVCTVDGTTVAILGAGDCTIIASQGGDGNYRAAIGIARTFTIDKAPSTTTVTATNITYTGSPYAGASASVTGAGGLNQAVTPISYSGRNGTVYGPSTTPPTNAGDYTASATYPGDANHTGSQDSKPFTIARAPTTIGAVRGDMVYGDTTGTAAATLRRSDNQSPVAGATIVFTVGGVAACGGAAPPACPASNGQGVATLTGGRFPAGLNAGTQVNVPVCASFAGSTNYLPSGPVCSPLVVARRLLWVKASDRTVVLKQPNPSTLPPAGCQAQATNPAFAACGVELANGSTFANGDDWRDLDLSLLRFQYARNPPSTNSVEKVGSTYRVTAFGINVANYDIRYLSGIMTVVAAP
ncbi:MAG: choice-of-anchor Q domain-containing protein [Thermomicrobiales bacterium]